MSTRRLLTKQPSPSNVNKAPSPNKKRSSLLDSKDTGKKTLDSSLSDRRSCLSREFSTLTLGARLENTFSPEDDTLQKKHLYVVCLTLFCCFAIVNFVGFVMVYYVIESPSQAQTTPAGQAVSFLGQWHKEQTMLLGRDEHFLGMGEPNTVASTACVAQLQEEIQLHATVTSPEMIEGILNKMGLAHRPIIRDQLQDLRTNPRSMATAMEPIMGCLQSSKTLPQLVCLLRDNSASKVDPSSLEETVHVALVFQALINLMTSDLAALHDVVEVMSTTQRVKQETVFQQSLAPDQGMMMMKEYQDANQMLHAVAMALSENKQLPLKSGLQLNILQAIHKDLALAGSNQNAQVGLALASSVHFEPTIQDHKLQWPLGKDWADAYMGWQTSLQIGGRQQPALPSLLIPLAVCPSLESAHAEDFVASQFILRALSQMIVTVNTETSTAANPVTSSYHHVLAHRMASSNFESVRLSTPSSESITVMLSELCAGSECLQQQGAQDDSAWVTTDTIFTANLDDLQFQVYLGFCLWITVLFAGLGLELLTWVSFLQGGWTDERQSQWKFAQFAFPLLLATTLGLAIHHNYLALICLVPGLWKFGFPETLVYMHTALYGKYLNEEEGRPAWIQRIAEFLNAVGTVVHHGAAALVICMFLAGVVPPTRHVLAPCLIPVMQHWFVLLRYSNPNIYTIVEMALEVYFEWTVLSEFEYLHAMHWAVPMAASTMLFAHWLYLLAAFIEMVKPPVDEEVVENRRRLSMQKTQELLLDSSSLHSTEHRPFGSIHVDTEQNNFLSMRSLRLNDISEGGYSSESSTDSFCFEKPSSKPSSSGDPTEDPTEDPTDRGGDVCIDFRQMDLVDLGKLEESEGDLSFVITGMQAKGESVKPVVDKGKQLDGSRSFDV
ncbi:expressed unknown protein [Seminavis robusta]|uniref:Uncharacterized protein n=1 Tax=Seminavis robusta TaxID=568900 RepID=A0A9N8H740_9STRA|nr:expressed unknown protein [Seminavis robusta]|eukprot:Sro130_g061880.1 n/a (894) ;mRNA; r:41620-44301